MDNKITIEYLIDKINRDDKYVVLFNSLNLFNIKKYFLLYIKNIYYLIHF